MLMATSPSLLKPQEIKRDVREFGGSFPRCHSMIGPSVLYHVPPASPLRAQAPLESSTGEEHRALRFPLFPFTIQFASGALPSTVDHDAADPRLEAFPSLPPIPS